MNKSSKLYILLILFISFHSLYSQTQVTDICDDGTFENSSFTDTGSNAFTWTLIPYNRIFEPGDNHQNPPPNDHIFNTTPISNTNFIGNTITRQPSVAWDNAFTWQSAAHSPWWGGRVYYKSNNYWEIMHKANKSSDFYFNPSKTSAYHLSTTFNGSNGALKLGSHNRSNHSLNEMNVKDGALTGYSKVNTKTIDLSAQAVAKKINVTENSFIVNFKYAVVFKEFYYAEMFFDEWALVGKARPFFGVRVFDQNNNSKWLSFGNVKRINSNTYSNYSSTNPMYLGGATVRSGYSFLVFGKWMEFNKTGLYYTGVSDYSVFGTGQPPSSALYCSPWRCGQLDLSQYIGQTIRLEFVVGDHYRGNGFAYAYIDDICINDNTCGNGADVAINVDKTCGPDGIFSGYFKKLEDIALSSQTGTKIYQQVKTLNIGLYRYNNLVTKVQVPLANIKQYANTVSTGHYSINSSDIYDALGPYLISNNNNDFDVVAEIEFNKASGNWYYSSHMQNGKLNGVNPNNSNNEPNDWSYCCEPENEKDNLSLMDGTCMMNISLDRNRIDFPPANKYNYYNTKSELYTSLLESNFDFNQTDGFFNWPTKIGSFDYHSKDKNYDCNAKNAWYKIKYKHKICNYYSEVKVETNCETPLTCDNVTCMDKTDIAIQPYLTNLMGNWRPWESFVYNIKRKKETQNVREGQYYENRFLPAYQFAGSKLFKTPSTNLIKSYKQVNYDMDGHAIEGKNALSLYDVKKYAYNNTLTHLVATNANYEECMYYSFESLDHNKGEMEFGIPNGTVSDEFLENMSCANAIITDEQAHSGKYSYKVTKTPGECYAEASFVSTMRYFCGTPDDEQLPHYFVEKYQVGGGQITGNQHSFKPVFELKPGEEYTLSYWVKNQDKNDISGLGYIDIGFECEGVPAKVSVLSDEQDIEGWILKNVPFTFQTGKELMKLVFYPSDGGTYFDDIRIYPKEANMKSYVYDHNQRMTAELDENNYTTFFDYDDEGNLIRLRKETERGIITLKENRSSLKQEN